MKSLLLSMVFVAGVGMAQSASAMPVHNGPQGIPVAPHHVVHGIVYHPHHGIYGRRVPHRPHYPYHPIHGIIIRHPGVVVHHPIGMVGPAHGVNIHGVNTHGIPVDPAIQHGVQQH